jgi:hypothetical protein
MSIPKKRKPRTAKKKMYFGPEVDESIIKYNQCEDPMERSRIYEKEIKYALDKLVENTIHTYKFYYTDNQELSTIQHEAVTFLIEKLPNFTKDKGKAFSYYSIVAKNYFILQNEKNFKKLTQHDKIDNYADSSRMSIAQSDDINMISFISEFVDYWDSNLDYCYEKRVDKSIAAAVVELFRRRETLEIFNKKALYIYIREMTDASTQQITRVVKSLKEKYRRMYEDYDRLGFIPKQIIY